MSPRLPNNDSPEDPLDVAFATYLKSCDEGKLTSREEFLAQFPDLSGQLKELIDAADMIGRVTRPPRTGAGSSDELASPNSDEFSADGMPQVRDPNAETVALRQPDDDGSGDDPAVTLPMAQRAEGDSGPTLPYDLGDYLLLDVIGRGGMGVVYRAKQSELDRLVAVKMIRSGILASDAEVRRFYMEAQAAGRLHHPGIVSVFQFGRRVGHHFFSMEYIRGTDLQRKINAGQIEIRQAATYVRDVARAIHHAHEKGVLHRDLKPANVLIDEDDQVHVTDFGLAKHLDCDSSVTASGDALGTPHYMAPEQAGGHSDLASCQSDVYALGAILFAALAGRPPLVGDTVMQTLVKVVHDPAPPVRSIRKDTPIDLNTIVAKCLEKRSAKRYASAEMLADELDAFLEGRPIQARPRSLAMRTWHWIEGVPLVGALMGRRVLHSSDTHRRFQAAMLGVFLLVPIVTVASLTYLQQQKEVMPTTIRLAGGIDGGRYTDISRQIAERLQQQYAVEVSVIGTGGSLDNRQRLLSGQIHVAPMQATAISGDDLCVIAPMFYESLFVVAEQSSTVQSVADLRGRSVAVGPEGSGSRATAELVLESLGLGNNEIEQVTLDWEELFSDAHPDVAMICIGSGSELISRLLQGGQWRLVPITNGIDIALQHPALRPMKIDLGEYSGKSEVLPTVGTTAYLTTRNDAPSELVLAILNALYADPPPSADMIPRRRAAEWQGLAFHPAARRFFRREPAK